MTFEDEVVGYAFGTGHHTGLLMIDERFHRQGLGTLLLARLEEHLFNEYDALELESVQRRYGLQLMQAESWDDLREKGLCQE